jgi:hypothetical protein
LERRNTYQGIHNIRTKVAEDVIVRSGLQS